MLRCHFVTPPQRIVIARWSGHLCLASGTSDLSLCHDGSPTKSWVLCTQPGVHVWQREDSQWISILISRPSAPWYKGNWHNSESTMVFKWCHSVSTKTEHPNTPKKAHTNSNTLDTLLSTHWSDLFKHSSRRQRGWRAGKLMNARVWTTWKCLCCPHVAFCSQESPIKPLAPRPSLLSPVLLTFTLFPKLHKI